LLVAHQKEEQCASVIERELFGTRHEVGRLNGALLTQRHRAREVRVKRVKKWLEKILTDPQHCSRCGASRYDLILTHEGKDYTFGLWKIEDRTKRGKRRAIAETDYKKLSSYFAR
jgi:hypothetical protein